VHRKTASARIHAAQLDVGFLFGNLADQDERVAKRIWDEVLHNPSYMEAASPRPPRDDTLIVPLFSHGDEAELQSKLQETADLWQPRRWVIQAKLGRGASGVVYLATDSRLGHAALKFSCDDQRALLREVAVMQRIVLCTSANHLGASCLVCVSNCWTLGLLKNLLRFRLPDSCLCSKLHVLASIFCGRFNTCTIKT
jgi:hypothetical protein